MDVYTKMMYGENARHAPAWTVVQNQGDAGVMIADGFSVLDLLWSPKHTHVLFIGEIIARPHFVVSSNDFAGRGIGGFWTHNPSYDEWIKNGRVLVDTRAGREAAEKWR